MSALAAVVIAMYAAAAFRMMQAESVETAGQRLTGVTHELATTIGLTTPQWLARASDRANSGPLLAFLRNPVTADSAAALALLAPAGPSHGSQLLDRAGRSVLDGAGNLPGGEADPRLQDLLTRSRNGVVGNLRIRGDSLTAPIAAAVMDGDSVAGYAVSWARITGAGQTQIEQIVGSDARLFIANASGDLWTDLSVPVDGLPVRPDTLDGVFRYERPDGAERLGAFTPVPNTPWVVAMEIPLAPIVARARSTIRDFVLIGLIVLLIAAAATWLIARHFTAPITELADTAEALSAGDYSRRSHVARSDEVGTLSRAFNTMAENVSFAHGALERQIDQLGRLESRNREVSERLRHVLSASPDATYELEATAAGMTFTWVSDNVERVLGASIEDVRTTAWWDERIHPEDAGPHVPQSPDFGAEGEATREYRLRQPDGRYRWIRDRQRLIGRGPDARTIVGAWSDVTEIRTLEEQFRQAQKLEAVGRLAGGIAHDFNNIVTVILGESDMALSALPPDSPLRESLGQVRTAGERAALLTRQLLTFSRKQLTETTTFSMNDVVRGLEDMLRRLIGEDVSLQLRLSDSVAPVNVDRGQVEQVLLNLVINARDAMPGGGTIVIETHDAVLDEEYARAHAGATAGEYVALEVSDNGTGITDEVREHLFEPFFTTKAPGKGTGLGLATSYGIAVQFGGHIGVYSELGVGTTMKMYLPRADPAELHERTADAEPSMRRGTETILLVEDEAQVRAIVARMLQAQGYRVMQAAHGGEALQLLARTVEPIDLLLTDLVMPQMGGRELAERVRELRPNLRVLFTSGYTEDVIVQNRLLEHDIVLLNKPFTRAALAAKVRETLDAPVSREDPGAVD